MDREMKKLYATISEMRSKAASGDMEHVLPRWRGELRREILMLPSPQRLPNMSMYELREVAAMVEKIQATEAKYGDKSELSVPFDGSLGWIWKRKIEMGAELLKSPEIRKAYLGE